MREIKFRAWDKIKAVMRNNVSTGTITIWGDGSSFDIDSESKDCVFMQYTGLKDKNGRNIFEGDVGRDIEGCLYEVRFADGAFETFYDGNVIEYLSETCDVIEIIGNIYENPELLESN